MKLNQLMAVAAAVALGSMTALAQSTTNFTFAVNQTVPDNNAVGLTLSTNLTVLGGTISSVTVSLDLLGGFNGDLYANLAGPNGGFAVLLNRVGVSNSASQFGYSDSGFDLTFDDSAANSVQYYQSFSYTLNGNGQLTGVWQPEGVAIDPQSSPSAFGGAPQSALLNSFGNSDPNGTWTLFLADLNAGGQGTVVSWGLGIATVPEPSAMVLVGMGLAGAMLLIRRRS
jgi:subtilisin-like proprotein convertase family protein